MLILDRSSIFPHISLILFMTVWNRYKYLLISVIINFVKNPLRLLFWFSNNFYLFIIFPKFSQYCCEASLIQIQQRKVKKKKKKK